MMTLLEELKTVLKKDERLISDNKLLKNRIVELALKLDENIIKLLLSNKKIREHFFIEIEGILIFDNEKLMKFINNKEFLPDSYTAFKINIGLIADRRYIAKSREVILSWPYKDCILEGGQEKGDEKRNEIFHNEILAPDEIDRLLEPKVFTNFKLIDKDGEHKITEIKPTDNLIIKGNNLLALHSVKKKFAGKIKLIYLDPPYNTGNDEFKYNDNFNRSTWLTFMKNRLEVAIDLLKDDGIIFIQIDYNELAHLKILMDEIFKTSPSGKSNFVQYVQIQSSVGAAYDFQNPFMPKNCEYGLIYAKNYDKRKYKPIWIKSKVDKFYNKIILNPEVKEHNKWKIGNVIDEFVKECGEDNKDNDELLYDFILNNINRIFRTISPKGAGKGLKKAMEESKKKTWSIYKRDDKEDILCYNGEMVRFYSKNINKDIDGNKIISRELGSLWTDISWTGIAPEGGVKLKAGKKPEKLLRRIIYMTTEPGEIVMDFFLGSGTTCAVAHKMGRQYIGIEQLDYGENDPVVRLTNVINGDSSGISKSVGWKNGGNFIYWELKELNEEYIQKIQKSNETKKLLKIWEEAKHNGFLSYRVDEKLFDKNIEEFKKLFLEEQKKILVECLEVNNLYVNYSEIEDKQYNISKEDIKLNKKFYGDL